MKPCAQHRQSIVLLAAGSLEAEAGHGLRQHLQSCPACRGYAASIESLASKLTETSATRPTAELPSRFHQRLVQRVREDSAEAEQGSWRQWLAWLASHRLAMAGVVVLAVALVFLRATHRASPPATPRLIATPSSKTRLESDPPPLPTCLAYQRALSESLDSLDTLLARQEQMLAANDAATTPLGLRGAGF